MELRQRALELFEYDPETGFFKNRVSRGRACIGDRAGSPAGHGYRKICVDYKRYYEHRLAWLIVHGEMPEELDHVDGNRSNNAILNLRLATRTQNNANGGWATGLSGLRGAYKDMRQPLKWYAKIQVDRRQIHIGTYTTKEDAHAAYVEAASKYFGEYAQHRRGVQSPTMETY